MSVQDNSLYDVLKNGYSKKKKNNLNGYILDSSLSNKNHQTYYNPKDKKLVFNVNGTNRATDWITNLKLATGLGYKESDRYKDSHKAIRDAKKKYSVNNATVTGHSQGGLTAQYISSKGDKVVTLDKATTIGGKQREGSKNYRSSGDAVSLLGVGRKNTINLENPNKITGNAIIDTLKAHNVDNIKDSKIFV